jgi:hypothetical protein
MRSAYYKCLEAHSGNIACEMKINPDECYNCKKRFLLKFEKGVDVALAAELVIVGGRGETKMDRIILVAGDGDYKEAIRFVRRAVGRDIQIVSWSRPLSSDLAKLSNKPIILLDDYWKELCEIRTKPPLEEIPATDEEEVVEGGEP